MDRADAEIEEENITEKSNWSALLLQHSWWIGKKVAITGAAITSAPVIIPPLFVLSTLGLAFSFPFGIYLAGYMCTHKIMSLLLPLPLLKEKGEIFEEDEMSKSDFENSANEAREDGSADSESSVSPKSPYTAVVLGGYEESSRKEYEPPNLCSEHLSIVELKAEGKAEEDGGEEEERLRVADGCVVAEDKDFANSRLMSDYVLFALIVPCLLSDIYGSLSTIPDINYYLELGSIYDCLLL